MLRTGDRDFINLKKKRIFFLVHNRMQLLDLKFSNQRSEFVVIFAYYLASNLRASGNKSSTSPN